MLYDGDDIYMTITIIISYENLISAQILRCGWCCSVGKRYKEILAYAATCMPKKYKQTAIRATEIQQQESDWGTMYRAVQLWGRGRASAALHGIMINVIWLHFDMHHNGQQSECHSFAFPKTIDSTPLHSPAQQLQPLCQLLSAISSSVLLLDMFVCSSMEMLTV